MACVDSVSPPNSGYGTYRLCWEMVALLKLDPVILPAMGFVKQDQLFAGVSRFGIHAAAINLQKVYAVLNAALNKRFAAGQHLEFLLPNPDLPYIVLDKRVFAKLGVEEKTAERSPPRRCCRQPWPVSTPTRRPSSLPASPLSLRSAYPPRPGFNLSTPVSSSPVARCRPPIWPNCSPQPPPRQLARAISSV